MKRNLWVHSAMVALVLLILIVTPSNAQKTEPKAKHKKKIDPKELVADVPDLQKIFAAVEQVQVKGKRWVRISTGPSNWSHDSFGWLIDKNKSKVTYLSSHGDLSTLKMPRPNSKRPKVNDGDPIPWDGSFRDTAWSIRNADFTAFCKEFLKGEAKEKPKLTFSGAAGMVMERRTLSNRVINACRYACWAHQHGQEKLTIELLTEAGAAHRKFMFHYGAFGGRFGKKNKAVLSPYVAERLGASLRNGCVSAGHHGTRRPELLKQWRIVAKIPNHPYHDEATRMIRGYQQLIKEDKAWKEPSKKALAQMTAPDKVNYWMYHLRDWNAGQWSDPGHCYVLGGPFGFGMLPGENNKKPNPALELKKLGYAALPEIIKHLDDTRATRCKGHWRSYWPDGHYLLCYGDCCQQIFEAITGHTIFQARTTVSYPVHDGMEKVCKEKALRWWKEFKKKGEKQMLIEGTTAGNRDSTAHATRLLEKYPKAAFVPITKGIRNSSEGWVRSNLVQCLRELKDKRVTGALLDELKGPNLHARINAAAGLVERNRPEGFNSLRTEWKRLNAENYGWGRFEDGWAVDSLVANLVEFSKPEAIEVLRIGLRSKSLYLRWHVLEKIDYFIRESNDKMTKSLAKAIDRLLVQSLRDTEECGAFRAIRWKGKEINNVAVGDLAATILAKHWKKTKAFTPNADFHTRRKQRIALANVWRKQQGLKSLALPPSLQIKPAPKGKIGPLLDALRRKPSRAKALNDIEALGLSALPAVNKMLTSLPKDQLLHKDVQRLAARLQSIVQEISFAPDSIPPTPQLRKQFRVWKGTQLTPRKLTQALLSAFRILPKKAYGIHFTLEHPGENTGVTMIVTLAEKRPLGVSAKSKSWQYSERLVSGTKVIRNTGLGTQEPIQAKNLEEFESALQTILNGPPNRSFSVRLSLAADQR